LAEYRGGGRWSGDAVKNTAIAAGKDGANRFKNGAAAHVQTSHARV